MICWRCESASREGTRPAPDRMTAAAWGSDRVRGVFCDMCGALLPPVDATASLLAKLSQLARFGLAAEDRPLLESTREGT